MAEHETPKTPADVAHDKAVRDARDAKKDPVRTDVDVDHDVDPKVAKEHDKVLAEAKKLDDAARKKNEDAEHDARVNAARRVFAPDEVGPDGTAARRLAHPGEVTDAAGNPNPFGDHVNLGTAFAPNIVPVRDLAPDQARKLGLPTGVGGGPVVAPDAPAAPEDVRPDPVAKTATK